jgi:hypothetical protein
MASVPAPDPAWFIGPDGFSAADTIHGLGHTRRVLIHALEIADALGIDGWEREAITCAALWHDIGRTEDGVDYCHGAKSAGMVVALGLHRSVEQRVYETALFAVTHHSGDENHGERAANNLRYHELQPDGTYAWREIDPGAALRCSRTPTPSIASGSATWIRATCGSTCHGRASTARGSCCGRSGRSGVRPLLS